MLRLRVRYCYYAAASAGLVCWCGWPVDEVFLHCCSTFFVSRGSYWLDHGWRFYLCFHSAGLEGIMPPVCRQMFLCDATLREPVPVD